MNIDEFVFHVLEVHTLHVRDFNGERLIQSLGNFQNYKVSTACAEAEARAVLFPLKRILKKCFPFLILFLIGVILIFTLTLQSEIFAVKALGFIAAFVGVSGMISECRKIFEVRKNLKSMTHDEALKFSAWQCMLKTAPKKFNDNDITYIPIDEETLKLKPEELAQKYNLLPAISKKAYNLIRNF